MRILILGAGKMGSFFTDILSFQHETAVFDVNPHQLRFVYNTYRFTTLEEIKEFEPELVINAATVKYTLEAFRQVLPVLPKDCIISDIASVKTGLKKFYEESGFRYVSTHPMFGPTFASLSNLNTENAIIISEGDHLGKIFFKDLYQTMKLNIFEYTLQILSGMKIEIAERLVQHHHLRLLGDIMGNNCLLLLAAAQCTDRLVDEILDAYQFNSPLDGIIIGAARTLQQTQTAITSHHHHLLHGKRCKRIKREILYDVAHPLSDLVGITGDVQAADCRAAVSDLDQAVNRLQ